MHRKQNPYPTNLKLNDLLKLKYDNQIKKLETKIKELEERIEKLEHTSIVSLSPLPPNITPRAQDPLPCLTKPDFTPDEIKDFHLYFSRQNADSFDNLE